MIISSQDVAVDSVEDVEMMKEYYIPDYILVAESETGQGCRIPACPVVVFINTTSGAQLGSELLVTYRELLNRNQVCYAIGFRFLSEVPNCERDQ